MCSFAYDGPSYGQAVVADETTGTTVSESAPFIVTGGSQQLTTLFHSFQEFSPDAANVLFQLNRSQDVVDTVISRVTGANTSFINGQLQLTGGNAPDLFLLNPNGIIFGANAELVLPGSFFVSTADRILFEDGLSFSSNLDAAPLLTVSAPVGLAFGDKANAVTINQSSLSLEPEQTLGIVGGDIQLTGSNVNISNGTLLLGSVAVGNQIDIDDRGFNYSTVSAFQDIALTDGTFIDVSGDGGGHFQIQGRVFSVVSDSVLEASNLGATDGGTVTIQTSDRVDIDGAFSNVFVDAFGQGRGNQLTVETNEFQLSGYAFMTTDTFSSGDSGGIAVQANTVSILGEANEDGRFTLLSSDTYDSGQAGNISIESNQFLINGDNAIVRLTSFDQGDAGDLSISADQLALDRGGIIAGSDDFASGNGGDLDLDVRTLKLTNGAQIASGTLGNGQAGDINIVATERIDIWGLDVIDDNFVLTGIIASAESGSTGNAGDITIVTPQLSLFRGSQIASSATGEGDSGDLRIRAGDIEIADNISETQFFVTGIVADVLNEATGNGGSIDIEINRLRGCLKSRKLR
ncbi:MAG: filamentous hemagglutinin N-terminal domain-containing protein [Cyanobacteria bacterium P01_D01_bin.56]